MNPIKIDICQLPHAAGLPLPNYQTQGAAGMDLHAALNVDMVETLHPGMRKLIPTGLSVAIPVGYEAQIRPRSGLALRHGITCLNTPGTIDADYRGEIKVILINHGNEAFGVERGERIAQMVIAPVARADWNVVVELTETGRGKGGFGSSGRN